MPESYKKLLEGNQHWVEHMNELHPGMFEQLSHGQSPDFLWIGCSDSRVPANEVTEALPGSIFVQRNIANQVLHTDSNLLSVVYYAVKVLHVKHIIVCGHYGCGGVQAAMGHASYGYLDNWLVNVKNVYRLNKAELDAITNEQQRFDRFVELNVQAQVDNLCMVSFIQEEWKKGEFPYVHGWAYRLQDGSIKDLRVTRNSAAHLEHVFRYTPSEPA
jgi:carbonic anhydrase